MLPETVSINPPVFDPIAAYGIGSIAIVVAIAWVILLSRGSGQRVVVLSAMTIVVMATSAIVALSGKLSQFNSFPPPMFIMIVSVFVMSFVVGFSALGREAAARLSFANLVGLQSFRFPLELVMHHAYSVGVMPVQLSFSGYSFDIVTGIGAFGIWLLYQLGRPVSRSFLWAWNLWGCYCLVVITIIAITTSPVARLFGDEPQNLNTWVLYFPYVWLPVVLVTIAISGHIVISRKLLLPSTT
jgi:hypothetical protein